MTTSRAKRTRGTKRRNEGRVEALVGSLLAALLALAIGPAARAEEPRTSPARVVVEQTLDAVLETLGQEGLSVGERRDRIVAIVATRFDFDTISRLVLARNYRRFTPEQRTDFHKEFKLHLSRTYGSRLNRYEWEDVEITGERSEPRGDVTVLTQIVGGQFEGVEIHYRLRAKDGVWRVIDVVIEGVSLVSSFRTQFQEVVSQGGAEKLLERLRQKNAAAGEGARVELAG